MRKFIGTIVIVVLIVAAIGWYQGWFTFNVEKENGRTGVNLSIDKNKLKNSVKNLKNEAEEAVEGGN